MPIKEENVKRHDRYHIELDEEHMVWSCNKKIRKSHVGQESKLKNDRTNLQINRTL